MERTGSDRHPRFRGTSGQVGNVFIVLFDRQVMFLTICSFLNDPLRPHDLMTPLTPTDHVYCLCNMCCLTHSKKLLATVGPIRLKTCKNHATSVYNSVFYKFTDKYMLPGRPTGQYPDWDRVNDKDLRAAREYCTLFYIELTRLPTNLTDIIRCEALPIIIRCLSLKGTACCARTLKAT